ncbi:hypothetical protein [Lewinella sp. IMCC34183]|uniref:hypothetical protein n=1 Tax=Lewinella sp. IMCC34183 TaxID=2248762 RepID=UPI000E247F38|nr:hypothetical protein [Lewinella sp. IMCC34183]
MYQYFTRLLLFCLLLGLTSCVDGGAEDLTITEADFVGSWTIAELSGDFNVTGDASGTPIRDQGSSSISNSDLQIILYDDGQWTSTGSYTVTIVTDDDRQVRQESGIGSGTWSYRNEKLILSGMENKNGNGYFVNPQECTILDFVRSEQVGLVTRMDVTESDPDFGITLRTQGEYLIQLLR